MSILFHVFGLLLISSCTQIAFAHECQNPGQLQCNVGQCNIILCASVGGDPIVVRNCEENTHCEFINNGYDCVPGACYDSNIPRPIICVSGGTVPSPYNCSIAYTCGNSGSPILECSCGPDEYFDTDARDCKKGTCQRNPVICNAPGDGGPLDGPFCYACDSDLNALVYLCAKGLSRQVAQPRFSKCYEYTGPTTIAPSTDKTDTTSTSVTTPTTSRTTTSTSTTSTTTTTPSTTTSTTTTTTTTPSPFTCKIVGQRFPDYSNPENYYECGPDLKAQLKHCPTGHYDPSKFACVK